jgi:hypothetical protein
VVSGSNLSGLLYVLHRFIGKTGITCVKVIALSKIRIRNFQKAFILLFISENYNLIMTLLYLYYTFGTLNKIFTADLYLNIIYNGIKYQLRRSV